ncbi:MAG: Clp protease ClpP [Tannerella sp.]|jgi:ATP-dependent protease ClpP protease subunit|nr:Clp protease ClpP [Tannerella sp.]
MNTDHFKNIVGECKTGETATIRLFEKITEESAGRFVSEFDFLENYIRPSLIRVLINSEGGSVMHGMTVYSAIQNSIAPTECVIEGMAASMASIVWAAGEKFLMRDYAILMIHNPFLPEADGPDSDMVLAFKNQITTIYRKRFGLKKEEVVAIMEGEAGKDGTYFDAGAAVKAGIIPQGNVLRTSKQLCDKVKNELSSLQKSSDIQALMTRISAEASGFEPENKHFPSDPPTLKQTQNREQMSEIRNNSPEYAAVAATLGLKENFEVKDVMARVSGLISVEAKLKETATALSDAQTVIAGKDATIQNLQKSNDELAASLNTYQTKETEEKKAKIEALVEAAVTAGKIDKGSKAQWIEMAEANYSLAENTLNSIPAPEKISKEIASDPANVQAAADAAKTAGEKMTEKVNEVVGENFKFKTIR